MKNVRVKKKLEGKMGGKRWHKWKVVLTQMGRKSLNGSMDELNLKGKINKSAGSVLFLFSPNNSSWLFRFPRRNLFIGRFFVWLSHHQLGPSNERREWRTEREKKGELTAFSASLILFHRKPAVRTTVLAPSIPPWLAKRVCPSEEARKSAQYLFIPVINS
jgi:hypothetical protein